MFKDLLIPREEIQLGWDLYQQYCWTDDNETYLIYRAPKWKSFWLWEIMDSTATTSTATTSEQSFKTIKQAQQNVEMFLKSKLPASESSHLQSNKLHRTGLYYVLEAEKYYPQNFYSNICIKRNNNIEINPKKLWYVVHQKETGKQKQLTKYLFATSTAAVDYLYDFVNQNLHLLYSPEDYYAVKKEMKKEQILSKSDWWLFFVKPDIDLDEILL